MVASLAEAWIEISFNRRSFLCMFVASLAEAWIEICNHSFSCHNYFVASLAEAWIEIFCGLPHVPAMSTVASLAEAWIEILARLVLSIFFSRLPRGGVD